MRYGGRHFVDKAFVDPRIPIYGIHATPELAMASFEPPEDVVWRSEPQVLALPVGPDAFDMGYIVVGRTIEVLDDLKIDQKNIYPCDRIQYVGYNRAYMTLKDGQRATFVTFANDCVKKEGEFISGFHATQQAAWDCFGAALRTYLADKPGVILWRMKPEADLNKHIENPEYFKSEPRDESIPWILPNPNVEWAVICRLAVTEDLRFTKLDELDLE